MIKFILVIMVYGMVNSTTVYNGMTSCMKFDSPKDCTDARTAIVDQFRNDENAKIYASLCVRTEITEDFTPENSVIACKQVMDKGMKEYGGFEGNFR